jgi:hypothetical protein
MAADSLARGRLGQAAVASRVGQAPQAQGMGFHAANSRSLFDGQIGSRVMGKDTQKL